MKISAKQLNRFIIFKLPSAYLCGVRVKELTDTKCSTSVRYKWINQNPFKSIYFAVLGMASELSTGAILLRHTHNTNNKFSTLVVGMNAEFYKKATGRITFVCEAKEELQKNIQQAIATKEGVAFDLTSIGYDEEGDEVAKFEIKWSIKVKK